MTSKAALKRMETAFSFNREGKENVYKAYTNSIYPYYEDFDLVMRDLEVLEILKKHYHSVGWCNGGVIKFWEMNEKELKKVREWLDEEKK